MLFSLQDDGELLPGVDTKETTIIEFQTIFVIGLRFFNQDIFPGGAVFGKHLLQHLHLFNHGGNGLLLA